MPANSTMPKAEALTLPAPAGDFAAGLPGLRGRDPGSIATGKRISSRRSRVSCGAGTPERRHFAGGSVAGLYRLAFAFGDLATAAARDFAGSGAKRQAASRSIAAFLRSRSRTVVPDQAASAGSALRPTGVGKPAVQPAGAVVSARTNNGGITRPPACAALPSPTRRSSSFRSGRCWMCWRRPILPRPIPKCCRRRSRVAAEFRVRLAELVQRLDAAVVGWQATGARH